MSEQPYEDVYVELDETVPDDIDLGEDEPIDAEAEAAPTTVEEGEAGYDADLDDADDDTTGYEDESGGDEDG